jgi:L-rhamnose-H+ transport protein
MNATALGLSIVLAAGAVGSATLLPMKFVRRWNWENSWLCFAAGAYFCLPLATAWWTVPDVRAVYAQADAAVLTRVALFGFGWGVSVVLLGLAVAAAGLAVSNAIILGCSISLGSLIPLLVADASRLLTGDGVRLLLANGLLLGGVVACAAAGHWRDRNPAAEQAAKISGGGLTLCFVAGLLTPLLNFALAAGGQLTELAAQAGASPHQAANAVWGLAVSAGSAPSLAYCVFLLTRRRTWDAFRLPGSWQNLVLCALMATLFIVSTVGYGSGAVRMGALGPVIGWPVYVSSLLIGNAFWGWLTGEWRGASRQAGAAMLVGLGALVAGIALLFGAGVE